MAKKNYTLKHVKWDAHDLLPINAYRDGIVFLSHQRIRICDV